MTVGGVTMKAVDWLAVIGLYANNALTKRLLLYTVNSLYGFTEFVIFCFTL
jgi:hypothetical protein